MEVAIFSFEVELVMIIKQWKQGTMMSLNFFSFEVIACDDNKNNGKGGAHTMIGARVCTSQLTNE